MRATLCFWGMLCLVGGVVACGGEKKDANSPDGPPSTKDETPKWEGATPATADTNRPSKPQGGVAPVEQPKQRSDQYDKEGTEVSLKRAARQVKDNCGLAKDENGKAIGPWGKATIQVQLGHNGHSKGVTVPAPFQGKPVGTCIEKSFSNLSFPPWGGADAEVAWEVELVEPAKK